MCLGPKDPVVRSPCLLVLVCPLGSLAFRVPTSQASLSPMVQVCWSTALCLSAVGARQSGAPGRLWPRAVFWGHSEELASTVPLLVEHFFILHHSFSAGHVGSPERATLWPQLLAGPRFAAFCSILESLFYILFQRGTCLHKAKAMPALFFLISALLIYLYSMKFTQLK